MTKELETKVLEQPNIGFLNRAKSAFSDTIKYIGKGLKKAILVGTAVASLGVAACKPIVCPNNPPYIEQIGTVQTDEGSSGSLQVEAGDTDGDPITYSLTPETPDWVAIDENGRVLWTAPQVNADTEFRGGVEVSDGTDTAVQDFAIQVNDTSVEPPVDNNYLDVSLQVLNNKTEEGQRAKVKVFDSADETTPLDGILQTDINGNLVYTSSRKLSQLSGVTLTAVLVDASGNPISYEHTLRYPAQDLSNVVLKPHPAPSFATMEAYQSNYLISNVYSGLSSGRKSWDFEGTVAPQNELKGIGIFTTNPLNSSSFSTGAGSQRNTLENKIKDANDIELLVAGSNLDTNNDGTPDTELDNLLIPGEPIEGVHYTLFNGTTIIPEPGYILIAPDSTISNWGETKARYYNGSNSTGIINRVLIYIKPTITGDAFRRVASHELKHALTNPNDLVEPYNAEISATETIARYDTTNTTIGQGVADIEDAYVTNESAYGFAANSSDFLRIPQTSTW